MEENLLSFFLFIQIPFIIVIVGIYKAWIRYGSKKWPYTDGEVTSHHVKRKGGGEYDPGSWWAYLILSYSIAGRTYSKKKKTNITSMYRKRRLSPKLEKKEIIAMARSVYPPGTKIPIYFHPRFPRLSVFEPGGKSTKVMFPVIALICYFIGFGLLILMEGESTVNSYVNLGILDSFIYSCFAISIFLIPILISLNFFMIYRGQMSSEDEIPVIGFLKSGKISTDAWTAIDGEVTSISGNDVLTSGTSSWLTSGTAYWQVILTISYSVAGQMYSKKMEIKVKGKTYEDMMTEARSKCPLGTRIKLYYNPKKPSQAQLQEKKEEFN